MVLGVLSRLALFRSGVTAVGITSFWSALSILGCCLALNSHRYET